MITRKRLHYCTSALLVAVTLLPGCGQSSTSGTSVAESDSAFLDDLFSEIDLTDAPLPQPGANAEEATDAPDPVKPVAMSIPRERLELRLSPGDRFPLVKTVEQTLVQKSELYPATAQTRLELHMIIQVNEVRSDAIQLDVRYTRVVYQQNINERRVSFDSSTPQDQIPSEAIPYAGMVQNGFAFWLGRDNRIREVIGYDDFLNRCVQRVPEQQRESLLTGVVARFGADSVANFVDDSIGLLPYDTNVDPQKATEVAVGDVWTRNRSMMQPVPVNISTTCRLLSLDEQTAKIDITGIISSPESPAPLQPANAVKVTGGRSMGSCTVDRRTGLPLELTRSRYLNLVVMTTAGEAVEQEKRIETTIQAFPESRGPIVQRQRSQAGNVIPAGTLPVVPGRGIQPTSATSSNESKADSAAGLSSTARAVYPD